MHISSTMPLLLSLFGVMTALLGISEPAMAANKVEKVGRAVTKRRQMTGGKGSKSSKDSKRSKGGTQGERKFSLKEDGISDTVIYLSGSSDVPSLGDHYIWSNPIIDSGDYTGGTIQGSCHRVTLEVTGYEWDCTYQYYLPEGTIFAHGGLGVEGSSIENGITGGTGMYSKARGYITVYFPEGGINGVWTHDVNVQAKLTH